MNDQTRILSHHVEDTLAWGKRLGEQLKGGEIIALIGELGSGKTHLIKGLAQGLEAPDAETVTSPTFTLINEYEGRLTLFHIDAYRLEDTRQLEAIGFDELAESGDVVVVEWADRVWDLLAEYEPTVIRLEHVDENTRAIIFEKALS